MKYHNIDSIHLSKKDYFKIFEWKENNRLLVRFFSPVLEEGVIVIENGIKQFFKQDEKEVEIELFFGENQVLSLSLEKIGNGQIKVKDEKHNKIILEELDYELNKLIADTITLHASVMAYMSYFMDQKIYVDRDIVQRIGSQKKKRKDKNRNKIIKIQHRVFNVRVGNNTNEIQTTKEFKRKTFKWTVRGHWRHLKNGKKIWVKSYKKGQGKESEAKVYKI